MTCFVFATTLNIEQQLDCSARYSLRLDEELMIVSLWIYWIVFDDAQPESLIPQDELHIVYCINLSWYTLFQPDQIDLYIFY